jgi:hypothetical protein
MPGRASARHGRFMSKRSRTRSAGLVLAGVVLTVVAVRVWSGAAADTGGPAAASGVPTPSTPPDPGPSADVRPTRAPAAPAATGSADADHAALAGLTPTLRERMERALVAARGAGVDLRVTSGWRSVERQQELLDAAVRKYGSLAAATRWVLPPADSAHVRGMAVDVGPPEAARWLERHGSQFGLCRRYDNEPWHFEALTEPGGTCPPREPYPVASVLRASDDQRPVAPATSGPGGHDVA